jgi:excisionase family DNA binding protein
MSRHTPFEGRELRFLTPAEFFTACRLSRSAGYELLRSGEVRHVRIGRKILIPESAVQAWLARNMVGGHDEEEMPGRPDLRAVAATK